MSLPKPIRPEYNTTIPSTGKRIKYQPFSVREEKVLILAAEGGDNDEITNAIANVLERCITSPSDIKISDLALFDIEYLFLKARSKSAGEKIKVRITDPSDETYSVDHELNIDKIGIKETDGHTDLIDLGNNINVKMRYPGIQFFNQGVDLSSIGASINLMSQCIVQIIHDEEVYNLKDSSTKEIEEWMEGLTSDQFQRIVKFFETMPKLSHSVTQTNKKTGKEFTVKLEGLSDFF